MLNFEYKIIDNYIVIEKYIGEEIIVEIPSFIENLPITHIGHSAFRGQNKIIDIKLPETLKSIGDYAFCDCRGLTEIHLPNSVVEAGNHSFYNCRNLEKVSIPSGLKTVGDGFIKNCDDIKIINLDSGKNLQVGVVAFFNELKQEVTLNIENENISLIFPYYDY
ncbi:MAG: leucine-rich repeat domain-containing protein [Anaerotignaceae bacterium]